MTPREAKQRLERIWKAYASAYDTVSIEDLLAFDMATNSLGAIEQIQWERDMSIKQLHDLGYGLGEKPREEVKKASNLIERQKAIDAILRLTTFASVRELYEYVQEHNLTEMWCGGINDAIDAVIAVPSAQPEQRWIPCSERLPEEDGLYIVACGFHGEHSTFAYWNGDYWSIKTPVIAWMPGIEPYKGDSDEQQ